MMIKRTSERCELCDGILVECPITCTDDCQACEDLEHAMLIHECPASTAADLSEDLF